MTFNKISEVNKSFIFFLIFTMVSSYLAYRIIDKGYDNAFASYTYDIPE
ncbi:hypothetical protein KAZ66_00990 [Candidatus Woesebacteria bacterium]|nr:hypothetical protein [Candidatus Woesebacteria bacterium]